MLALMLVVVLLVLILLEAVVAGVLVVVTVVTVLVVVVAALQFTRMVEQLRFQLAVQFMDRCHDANIRNSKSRPKNY